MESSRHLAGDLILASVRLLPERGQTAAGLPVAFAALLADGREAGDVRDDLPLDFLAEMVVGAFSAVLIHWVGVAGYPLQPRLAHTAAFLGDAIAPPG